MDTTMPSAAPDLQTSLRHLRRFVAGGALALALLGAAAGLATPAHAAATGKDPEVPTTPGLTACCMEVPVPVPSVAGDPSQWGLTGSKDPEFPVTPGIAGGKDPEVPVVTDLTRKVNEYEGQHR